MARTELRPDVVGIGANSVDYIALLPAFPQPSGPLAKIRLQRHGIQCGGQMATCLATCARLGLKARYVGATGNDANGRLVREKLAGLGLDITNLVVHEASNQFAYVLIDRHTGERVILWDRDERLNLSDEELPTGALASARLVHVDDTDVRAATSAARFARSRAVPVTSDIDRVTDRTEDLVDAVSVAIFAEHVPLALTGRGNIADALAGLPRRADQILCATLGRGGAVALDSTGLHEQPAFAVRVVDTTGAGDVFRGAYIYGHLRGWPLDERLRFANAAAAVACTRLGALASVPSLPEIEALLGLR